MNGLKIDSNDTTTIKVALENFVNEHLEDVNVKDGLQNR